MASYDFRHIAFAYFEHGSGGRTVHGSWAIIPTKAYDAMHENCPGDYTTHLSSHSVRFGKPAGMNTLDENVRDSSVSTRFQNSILNFGPKLVVKSLWIRYLI